MKKKWLVVEMRKCGGEKLEVRNSVDRIWARIPGGAEGEGEGLENENGELTR